MVPFSHYAISVVPVPEEGQTFCHAFAGGQGQDCKRVLFQVRVFMTDPDFEYISRISRYASFTATDLSPVTCQVPNG